MGENRRAEQRRKDEENRARDNERRRQEEERRKDKKRESPQEALSRLRNKVPKHPVHNDKTQPVQNERHSPPKENNNVNCMDTGGPNLCKKSTACKFFRHVCKKTCGLC